MACGRSRCFWRGCGGFFFAISHYGSMHKDMVVFGRARSGGTLKILRASFRSKSCVHVVSHMKFPLLDVIEIPGNFLQYGTRSRKILCGIRCGQHEKNHPYTKSKQETTPRSSSRSKLLVSKKTTTSEGLCEGFTEQRTIVLLYDEEEIMMRPWVDDEVVCDEESKF